jgi:hypothetical protein
MRFIPTHCEACTRTALVRDDAFINGQAACAQCGHRTLPLPGESYAAEDIALFEELRSVLEQANISPAKADALRGELGGRTLGEPGRGLKRLTQLVPALGLLELVVPGRLGAQRKAEGMLATLLDGLARGRTRSGTMSAVSGSDPERGNGTS